MSRIRPWTPGRAYTTAIPGRSWYATEEEAFIAAALLDGSTFTNWPDVVAAFGPWDEQAMQVWIVRIPDTARRTGGEGPEGTRMWQWALGDLFDKPHRAIRDGIDDGEIVSRTDVREIPGTRLLGHRGLIRDEGPRDARAVRLWQASRLRSERSIRAARRRWRRGTDAETWRGAAYKGLGRKYYRPRKGL